MWKLLLRSFEVNFSGGGMLTRFPPPRAIPQKKKKVNFLKYLYKCHYKYFLSTLA